MDINVDLGTLGILNILCLNAGFEQAVELGSDLFRIDGKVFKAKASKTYFYIRNGDTKMQIFYGVKGDIDNLITKFKSILSGRSFLEMNGDNTMLEEIKSKLCVHDVVQYKKEGKTYFRVKGLSIFKSLNLNEDGKSVKSVTFEGAALDIFQNVSIEQFDELESKSISELKFRMENLRNIICKLNGL